MDQPPPASPARDDLVELAVAGDPGALEQLLLAHYDRLHAAIARDLPPALAARLSPEDLVQEACFRAFRAIGRFSPQGPGAFTAWLLTIGRRCVQDALRKHLGPEGDVRREAPAPVPAAGSVQLLIDAVAGAQPSPSRCAAGREAAQALQIALAGLPEHYRRALTLRYLEGLPVAAVARQMGRTDRAVHMLLNRGLKALRVALGRASAFLSRGA